MALGLEWPLVIGLLLLGACTGFLAGLLGVGGGMLLVPFMTALLGSRGFAADQVIKTAIATSLATICFTSISSVRAHAARGAVRWDIVAGLTPGIAAGAFAGAHLAKLLPSALLGVLFAMFVSGSATQMLIERKPAAARQLPGAAGMLGAGGGIGLLASLVGAGGAFVSVPFMAWCNVPIHNAVATSAAIGFPIALAGTLGYVVAGWSLHDLPAGTLGYLYLPALLVVATASISTAPWGARTAHRMPVKRLRAAFAVLLYLLAGYMAYRALAH